MQKTHIKTALQQALILLAWVAVLAIFFAQVEIQIEGAAGWGKSLPTWRIEHHWLLDLFWGGRAMTGYHAWVFPFIAMMFHFPFFLHKCWSWALQARVVAAIIVFWIIEDAMWFVLNPAYGWQGLNPANAEWHKHWLFGLPVEYCWGSLLAFLLMSWSYWRPTSQLTATK